MSHWAGPTEGLSRLVADESNRCLAAYREQPIRVESDANIETTIFEGGYGRKQIFELVQNAADALRGVSGRIEVVLTDDVLYVANEGEALSETGVKSLLGSHQSGKRDESIGRYGLGFKSVVALSDRPQIFSRSGSFGFDRDAARRRIRQVVPDAPRFPVLRLASPLDPMAEAGQDGVLAELFSWATTVVRVPLDHDAKELEQSMEGFPAEFMLFSPQARELVLHNARNGARRRVTVTAAGDGVLELTTGDETSEWIVVTRAHKPSRRALADAGELARREVVHVTWAVPRTGGRRQDGQFWAYFPTEDRSTLAGIVNAPWKLSEDRRRLLDGAFNKELLTEVLPSMVSSVWHRIHDSRHPQRILDVLPGRGKEMRSWADQVLNEPVFQALRRTPSLPDTSGRLKPPRDLLMHPSDIPDEAMRLWSAHADGVEGWLHPRCAASAEHRSKSERLMGPPPPVPPTIERWVEAIRGNGFTVEGSARALVLVGALVRSGMKANGDARNARVVLLENGTWARPVRGKIFVRSSPEDGPYQFIHPDLARSAEALAALQLLGVQLLDRAGELRHALSRGRGSQGIEWARVWLLARQCRTEVARDIFIQELPEPVEHHARVKTLSGTFRPINECFFPGPVVSASSTEDQQFCIDSHFHENERALVSSLGAVDQPLVRQDASPEPWLERYHDKIKGMFVDGSAGSKPQFDRLVVSDGPAPWPLQALDRMSEHARWAVTERVIPLATTDWVTVRHETQAQYGIRNFRNPVIQRLRVHGRLLTSFGPLRPDHCILAADALPDDLLPTVDLRAEVAEDLGVNLQLEQLAPAVWSRLHLIATSWTSEPGRAAKFYAWSVHFSDPPDQLLVQVGTTAALRAPQDVAVVGSRDVFNSLREQQIPVVLSEDEGDAKALQELWGLAEGTRMLERELVFSTTGEAESIVFHYPSMKLWLRPEQHDTKFQICSEIHVASTTPRGQRSRTVTSALHEGTVLVTEGPPTAILGGIADALDLEMTPADIRSVLDHLQDEVRRSLVAHLQNAPDDATRLSMLVEADVLRRTLPRAALEAIELEQGATDDPVELAGLVLAVQGVGTLSHFRAVLEEKGLNPPQQWGGLRSTRAWVAELGFAPELAGFAGQSRPSNFIVDGPTVLGELHPYQEICVDNIRKLLRGGHPRRGLVSLPTGAGKTRVAVQALVEEISAGTVVGPVVWIAQSDELCEQAVETWSYIWRSIGPREPLAVGRLWGSNEVPEEASVAQVVVATPQKLREKEDKTDYAWLTDSGVVVVDEAHTSISPMYTQVLRWLGRRARTRRDDKPLIGLTATPFRNTNLEETRRLINRYDANRLDGEAFADDEPYPYLQASGVLAQVDQRVIDGADVRLTEAEQGQAATYGRLPSNVEARLGADVGRNKRIVDHVLGLDPDWPVLIFASSVENARALAAQLVHKGVSSVAIDSSTPVPVRRWYVDEFKAGRIRVIANYNVLSQGFDAPSVKAVYVTRPTFSANLYQQMIGRGLRGPLNGGSERVLIVNVRDNIEKFGDKLAFTEFEYLWRGSDSVPLD